MRSKITLQGLILIILIGLSAILASVTFPVYAQQPSSTLIECSPQPVSVNSLVTLNAQVFGSYPNGTIIWSSNSSTGVFSSNITVLSSGYSSVNYTDTSAGNKKIMVTYSGDQKNAPSTTTETLTIYREADFNHDKKIDEKDFTLFILAYNDFYEKTFFKTDFDLNCDNNINSKDIALLIMFYINSFNQNQYSQPTNNPITATNLAPMFQVATPSWGDYDVFGEVSYRNSTIFDQCTAKDNTVLHDRHASIRIDEAVVDNPAREVNYRWITVQPGDRVVMRCWIKTESLPYSVLPDGAGAIIGFDYYHGVLGRISEVHPRTIQSEIWRTYANGVPMGGGEMEGKPIYVPYGTSSWTLLTVDVTIPYTYYAGEAGAEVFPYPVQIQGIIPWIGMSWNSNTKNEQGAGWFADAELYINP